jgi:hypothetical protein
MEPEFVEGQPEEVERLAAKTLRPERRISAEDLVASELASAILSEPLAKIRHVCEALMLLDEAERKQAGITEEEAVEAEKLYGLSIALQNTYIHQLQDDYGRTVDLYASITWPFPQDEASEWLGWAEKLEATYWCRSDAESDRWDKALKKLGRFERLYKITRRSATMTTYRTFMTRFEQYAMPKATALMKKIILMVSPDSYRQALQILRGGRRGKPEP